MSISHRKDPKKSKRYSIVFLALAGSCLCFGQSQAAESRPVVQTLPFLSCSSLKIEKGEAAQCVYKTKDQGDWEIGYHLLGKQKRSLKNQIKNLVVLFHPSGNSFRLDEWWAPLITDSSPLDPQENTLLSIGLLGDLTPKIGSKQLLNASIMLEAITAVIDHLFTSSAEFYVGGPSKGGQVAYMLASTYPNRVKGLFMVASLGSNVKRDIQIADQTTASLLLKELEYGEYSNWSKAQKQQWWKETQGNFYQQFYTDHYFELPESMVELGLAAKDFKSPADFKTLVLNSWVDWAVENIDPFWQDAQEKAVANGLGKIQETKAYKKLPKKILLMTSKDDQLITSAEIDAFLQTMKSEKKDVQFVQIPDVRGHMSCCSSSFPEGFAKPLRSFLQ